MDGLVNIYNARKKFVLIPCRQEINYEEYRIGIIKYNFTFD